MGMSPPHVIYFKASHWSSGHMVFPGFSQGFAVFSRGFAVFSLGLPVFLFCFCFVFKKEKSRNLYKKEERRRKIVLVLLSSTVERFFVSCMRDFLRKILSIWTLDLYHNSGYYEFNHFTKLWSLKRYSKIIYAWLCCVCYFECHHSFVNILRN